MLVLLALSLSLSLLPAPAHAAPPAAWSVVASACVPDDDALPRLRVNMHYVSVQAGVLTLSPQGAPAPLRLRCAIHLRGRWRLQALEATVRDPDGRLTDSRMFIDLRRLSPAVLGGVQPLLLVRLHSSLGTSGGDATVQAPLFNALADFTTDTFWLDISLWRTSPLVLPPRLYRVRLLAVPATP